MNPKRKLNLKPFKKGQPSANPRGRPKKLPALDAVIVETLGSVDDVNSGIKKILDAVYRRAARGDIKAAELLLTRAYGKPKQQIELDAKVQDVTRPFSDEQVNRLIEELRNKS